jgi:hypothetical protein
MDEKQGSTEIMTYTPPPALVMAETASTAMATQAKAMVEARYIMAERHPRDIDQVRSRILHECKRPTFAEVAIYRKPIGKGIEGPSIRFAEAAIRCMGNIDTPVFTVYDDEQKRIVRVCVTDLENNVTYTQDVTVTKTVERRSIKQGEQFISKRLNSFGDQLYILAATDDDILNKQNALISKAVRTLGLRIVPGDIIDEAMWLVRKTAATKDAEDPDAAKCRLFDGFQEQGVTPIQLKEYLGHNNPTLNPAELKELRGLYSALRDGEATWREIMDARKPATPVDGDQDKGENKTTRTGGSLKDAIKGKATQATTPEAGGGNGQPPATSRPNSPNRQPGDIF